MILITRFSRNCGLFVLAASMVAWQPTAYANAAVSNAAEVDTSKPTLYVTSTAHLDTQWLWTIQKTIDSYIKNTLEDNFALFEKYPNYNFSFEGSFRYMLAKEYYPDLYEKLKQYVEEGRWHVCGASVDGGDVNVPSPESLIRHILYGNAFYEREFGKTSSDIFLPDCFGFGYALPSVAAHCGLKGFSTQKLTWGSSVGIPFDVGFWRGVDGKGVMAALNPGAYVSTLREDLSESQEWLERINKVGEDSGSYVNYKYIGVGDIGGAPDDESVEWLEKAIAANGPVKVMSTPADKIFNDLTPEQVSKLPVYDGELLMTRHGTGCYTSQCNMKRWNRQNEMLADATERACVIADWLGESVYPKEDLEAAWTRFIWHHMHDDLTGTSIPQAYAFSWNDELLSLKQFSGLVTHAIGSIARKMDARSEGAAVVVYNPVAAKRTDLVTARVSSPNLPYPTGVKVLGPDKQEVPSQYEYLSGDQIEVTFVADVDPLSLSVYDVVSAEFGCELDTDLRVSTSRIENDLIRVTLTPEGDIASVFDKQLGKEVLRAPSKMQYFENKPDYWSEWEIRYEDLAKAPYAELGRNPRINVVEAGPARAVVEVRRELRGSSFVQRISLATGNASDTVVVDNVVNWRTPTTLLKASFPFAGSNAKAVYDLGYGTIERSTNTPELYEVPGQQWASITDTSGEFGLSILNDCKYGWDKPNDHTLRLTLVHLPNDIEKDMGWHRFTYAYAPHGGDWRKGRVMQRAARLNQPLMAFQVPVRDGMLGRRLSFLDVSSDQVVVRAIKQAEKGTETIVRVQEAWGRAYSGASVKFPFGITSARELNGSEAPIGDVTHDSNSMTFDLAPYQTRTFAVRLASMGLPPRKFNAKPVALPYDTDVVSRNGDRKDGDFDGQGRSIPAELLPSRIMYHDIPFEFGPTQDGANNAVTCRGQGIDFPKGDHKSVHMLLASKSKLEKIKFFVGSREMNTIVRSYSGWIGQSDSLVADGYLLDGQSIAPPYIHDDEVVWIGTHRHLAKEDKDEPYVFCYLFRVAVDVGEYDTSINLPDNPNVIVMAITVTDREVVTAVAARPFHDEAKAVTIEPQGGLFIDPVEVKLSTTSGLGDIMFTMDGEDPDESHLRYEVPLTITSPTVLKARVRHGSRLEDFYSVARFEFAEPRPAVTVSSPESGVMYSYYEGEWRKVPDFSKLTPIETGLVSVMDTSKQKREEYYGFSFKGMVKIPVDGVYTFFTSSDDGSNLYIGDTLVVDNDGLHGEEEKNGKIALAAGYHPIRVTYFERTGDDVLTVSIQGPSMPKQPIPGSMLSH